VEAQGPEPLAGFVDLAPEIVAGEADMLPAQRREQFVGHVNTAAAQMPDGTVEIDSVPKGDCRGEKGQPGGTMTLVLERAVAQFAEAVEEDRTGKRVAGLTLVEMLPVRRRCSGSSAGAAVARPVQALRAVPAKRF
jgi:hypothetical protein